MCDISQGYQTPKTLIENLLAAGYSKYRIAQLVGLNRWTITTIIDRDSDTNSLAWFKLYELFKKLPEQF